MARRGSVVLAARSFSCPYSSGNHSCRSQRSTCAPCIGSLHARPSPTFFGSPLPPPRGPRAQAPPFGAQCPSFRTFRRLRLPPPLRCVLDRKAWWGWSRRAFEECQTRRWPRSTDLPLNVVGCWIFGLEKAEQALEIEFERLLRASHG